MFTGLISDAFISASIQVLVERIVSYLLRKKDSDFDGLLTRLRTTTTSLSSVNLPETMLDSVREAIFDAEDLIDEIDTDRALSPLDNNEPRAAKRRKIFGFFYRDQSSGESPDMVGRVRRLVERLENLAKLKEVFLVESSASTESRRIQTSGSTPSRRQRLPSTSVVVDELEVVGREKEKEKLVEALLDEVVVRGEKVGVVPIVGMGGVGKTALVRAIFNDCSIDGYFQVKIWVCVSEDFDACRVTAAILGDASSLDLNSLQVRLREKLAGKRFLIVLDDLWNEDYLDWDSLSSPFRSAAGIGSKFIVTTRSHRVADTVTTGTSSCLFLRGLTEESGKKLLAKHAGDFSGNPDLEASAREIVRKCNGLPLAIKSVAGILRSSSIRELWEWERVARSDLWEIPRIRGSVFPALNLSYQYLSSPMQRCFAYCSIFPKGHEFDREDLVLLWMAENLLESSEEVVGEDCFDELVSRSFFQKSTRDRFVIHDLLVDLAKSVSEKHCFLSETSGSFAGASKARHFAYVPKHHYPNERFGSVLREDRLRTFLSVESMYSCANLSEEVVEDLVLKLRRLRVLSLSGYKNINLVPDSIGDLKHLRYLNLSSTSISQLPDSTTKLFNLQTLKLACCFRLNSLPKDFHRLVNLRHLDLSSGGIKNLPENLSLLLNLQTLKLSRCRSLTELPEEFCRLVNLRRLELEESGLKGMPVHLGELKSLKILTTFFVGNKIGAGIADLGGLSDLQEMLHIKNLHNVKKSEDAFEARLKDMRFLKSLRLEWGCVSKNDIDFLDYMCPNTSLKKLELIGYGREKFPNWLGHQSFCSVVEIFLSNCSRCPNLPPLGQLPSLKNLFIRGLDSVVKISSEFYGESTSFFASLEVLEIKQMRRWKEWSSISNLPEDSKIFPKLKRLCIESCDNLTGALPSLLPSLTDFSVSMCTRLVSSLPAMPNVEKIEIKMCHSFSRVIKSNALESFPRLQRLEVSADSLSMCLNSVPCSLKTLKIQGYRDLEFRLLGPASSVEELSIDCSDEGSFAPELTLDSFPNIRILRIGGYQNIASLWSSSSSSSSTATRSLSVLEIVNCHDEDLFKTIIIPNLTSLSVRNCTNLQHISPDLKTLSPSLESLTVKNCPRIETLTGPQGPLPPILRQLTLENCDGGLMASRGLWGLRKLGHLSEITIGGCDGDSAHMALFPEEGLLPEAVTELSIWYLECLETLDNYGLQRLRSLRQLLIYECPNLAAMTEAALPPGLESLRINGCPLLQENCRRDSGKYWGYICHVPWIYFDYKLVS